MAYAVGTVVYVSSRLRAGECNMDGLLYHIHCNPTMAALAGTQVTITAVLQENVGVRMYRIAEDGGNYMWSDVMLVPSECSLPTIINEVARITPEFVEYLYRSTGAIPLQQSYFRNPGGPQHADIMGVQMLAFGYTPESEPDSFSRWFYSEQYVSGLIAGWDGPLEDPALRAKRVAGSAEEYRQGFDDACEALYHLKRVGLISEVSS